MKILRWTASPFRNNTKAMNYKVKLCIAEYDSIVVKEKKEGKKKTAKNGI